MKYKNVAKKVFFFAFAAVIFTACEKVKEVKPIGNAGQTIVKFIDGGSPGSKSLAIDFVPKPTTITLADLRRDIPNSTELNKTMKVTILDDTAALRAYDTTVVYLPQSFYTLGATTPKIGGTGGIYDVVMNPGEAAKSIDITIPNATVLNPSTKYGLAFTITTADAGGKISTAKTIVVTIGAKNDWDGIYAVSGPMTDAVNPALVQWTNQGNIADPFPIANGGAWELRLETIGANTCLMFDNTVFGDYFHPIWTGTTNSGYGSFALIVNFDKATNTVASVTNYYGQPAGNTRSAKLDPTGLNAVQTNRDVLIKYWMVQTNQATGSGPRTIFDEKWKYIGPR